MEIPNSARRKVSCVLSGGANRSRKPTYAIALLCGGTCLSCLRRRTGPLIFDLMVFFSSAGLLYV